MQNIVIIPHPYWGPVNGSLKLSRTLKEGGYNIIYIIPPEFNNFILQQGFEAFIYAVPPAQKKGDFIQGLIKSYLNLRKRNVLLETYANQLINAFKPILILIDSDVPRYAAVLQKHVKLIMYSITPSNDRESNIPPYFSKYIPENTFLSRLYVNLIWNIWYIRKKLYFLRYELLSLGYFDFNLRKYYSKHGLDIQSLNFDRVWPVGFKNIPELMLYPAQFDFNKDNKSSTKYHLSSMVDLHRKEEEGFEWEKIHPAQYVILCSMGTLAGFYYPGIHKFFDLLIQVVSSRKDITLILTIGQVNYPLDKRIFDNIHIYSKVPLLKVLEKCDLFINHAGMNSVQESILKNVPLLLFPLSKQNDQNGIAARCVFHGIGKRGDIRRVSAKKLMSHINEILTDQSYSKNIALMRNVFSKPDLDSEILLDLVRSKTA